ncbi:BlaI/MecI/CopY family transcriptional regulator [Parabacteroides pacaensis]|uniref:BlaI/MecI/CopY family transcriptional regulator n=1 Tax=Parabacteroides pacaensis TaxID=2086575 RepID=UPI000D113999|nr:BlaI/MecI/CopY family transcriptional regulator [Parabacteroides pacaensis]
MQLTKAEEQVMQYLWELKESQVQEIREQFDDPKPSRTTVSTIIRILETKGFVGHKPQGRGYTYYPLVAKEDYSKHQLFGIMKNYFNDSFTSMASFFAKESNLTIQEIEALLEDTKEEIRKELKK